MNHETRFFIIENCKKGEQKSAHKSELQKNWKLGKLLSFGLTRDGYPFVVFEYPNFASIVVGRSVPEYNNPPSHLRNDASCNSCILNSFEDRMKTAERMSKEILY